MGNWDDSGHAAPTNGGTSPVVGGPFGHGGLELYSADHGLAGEPPCVCGLARGPAAGSGARREVRGGEGPHFGN
jgi:hypothetical protein